MQWLVVILLIVAVYYLFIRKPKTKEKAKNTHKKPEEIMVECEKCGVYVSSKEAIIKDGAYFCSHECAKIAH
ncbi:PP0621 family protein [Helicobacter burdigaliensis]|uniref:PP0621 family protein n=1 Tax=Helicobacter burdigaliensis TaxID=2315334 RepID=UPI000EF6A5FE|nr:PP0621 family protein [Helicobacter burdigaliensis]